MAHGAFQAIRRLLAAKRLKPLRRLAGAFKRTAREFLVAPARWAEMHSVIRSNLENVSVRLAEIDRRTSEIDRRTIELEQYVRQILPWDHDFSRTGTELIRDSVVAINQNWPSSSQSYGSRIACNTEDPVPPLASRARIQGAKCVENHPQNEHFLNSGVHDLRAVYNIAGVFGLDLDQSLAVLDFGVGCARMARHLPSNARERFMGVDVDTVNIGWCREHMPFGRFEAILPGSTIPVPDRHFDLVYSHSVFTHLAPAEQNHWLRELSRVSKGLIILSVHGICSAFQIASWSRDPKYLAKWLKEGFVDAGVPNPDISDVVDREYYRDVAHAPSYVRRHWSSYLDVVEIIPGGFGKVHDAIVLRSKCATAAEAIRKAA